MKKIFTISFALFAFLALSAQDNLLRNGDFELGDASETIAGLEDWHMDNAAPSSGWWAGHVGLTSDDSATLYQVVEPISADSVLYVLSLEASAFFNTSKVVMTASTSDADSTVRTLLESDSIDTDAESFEFKFGFSDNSAYVGKNLIVEITITPDTGSGAWTNFDNMFLVKRLPGVNNPPVCDPGAYQSARGTEEVTLDGSGSSDPDGDDLTYTWKSTYPGIVLSDPSAVMPTFTAPDVSELTTYSFALFVNDGTVNSDTLLTNVTVIPASELVMNGDFSLDVPDSDPESTSLKDVANWNVDELRDSLNGGRWGTFVTLASADPTFYQVLETIPAEAAVYSLSFSARSSWNCISLNSIFSVSDADSSVRTEIAMQENPTVLNNGVSPWTTYKQILTIPENSEYVGKKLIIEFDNIPVDDGEDNGWAEVDFVSVVKEGNTGISANPVKNLTIYPNPSSGMFYIDSGLEVSRVDVYSILGSLKQSVSGHHIDQINLEGMQSGLYMISLTTENGIITNKVQIK